MRALIVLAVIVSAVSALTFAEDPKWAEFKAKFAKGYSISEEPYRYQVFLRNLERAAALQLSEPLAKYGATMFSDLTQEEFSAHYLAKLDESERESAPLAPAVQGVNAPASYDARTQGLVVAVKNQGQCGSCWAFSATATIEGSWAKAGHTLTSFAESQIVDCDTTDSACNGGWPVNAINYIIKAGGIETEAIYPYVASKGTCKFNSANVSGKVTHVYQLANNETAMLDQLIQYGPLSICIDASKFNAYTSGIMTSTSCKTTSPDHAVLIVGYGVEGTTNYWIVKNSWAASWGEQGYVRMQRGVNCCGVGGYVVAASSA